MEQTDIFSWKIRWLAITTGVASALALFPILFLLYPALLIAGGIIQPRFPTIGKWFVWAGAANLGAVLIIYDAMFFLGSGRWPHYATLMFSASTVLLLWCSAELVADGLKRMRARRSIPPAEPRPVTQGVWILAVILNLFVGWVAAGRVLAPSSNGHSGNYYALATSLAQALQAVPVVVLDISLIRRVVKLSRARGAGPA